jgi:hypothetical protein
MWIAADITGSKAGVQKNRFLLPLPVLGSVPRWWPDNENLCFEDILVFRPKTENQQDNNNLGFVDGQQP